MKLPPRGPRGHPNNELRKWAMAFSRRGMTPEEALRKAEEHLGIRAVWFELDEEGQVREVLFGTA